MLGKGGGFFVVGRRSGEGSEPPPVSLRPETNGVFITNRTELGEFTNLKPPQQQVWLSGLLNSLGLGVQRRSE
jgi:hypothetical protein